MQETSTSLTKLDQSALEKIKQAILENKYIAKNWLNYITGGRVNDFEEALNVQKNREKYKNGLSRSRDKNKNF